MPVYSVIAIPLCCVTSLLHLTPIKDLHTPTTAHTHPQTIVGSVRPHRPFVSTSMRNQKAPCSDPCGAKQARISHDLTIGLGVPPSYCTGVGEMTAAACDSWVFPEEVYFPAEEEEEETVLSPSQEPGAEYPNEERSGRLLVTLLSHPPRGPLRAATRHRAQETCTAAELPLLKSRQELEALLWLPPSTPSDSRSRSLSLTRSLSRSLALLLTKC